MRRQRVLKTALEEDRAPALAVITPQLEVVVLARHAGDDVADPPPRIVAAGAGAGAPARAARGRGASGRLIEDRPEDPVRLPDVLGPPPAGDERKDLFRLLARHRGRLVGPHVRELTQRDLERDRHPIEAVNRDRLLTALDLADELSGEAGAITQPLLAVTALLVGPALAAPRISSRVAPRVRS